MEKLLTTRQVGELLAVSCSQVYKWVHYGYVPYIKLGHSVRFRESDLSKWLKKRERKGRVRYKTAEPEGTNSSRDGSIDQKGWAM